MQTYSINHVVHQGVNFGPLKSGLATVLHYFCVSTYK